MPSDWTPPGKNAAERLCEEGTTYRPGPIAKPHAEAIPPVPTALGALDASGRAEFWASLALSHTRGMGARRCKRLLETFGSAFAATRHCSEWKRAGINEECIRSFASETWRKPQEPNGMPHARCAAQSCFGRISVTPQGSRSFRTHLSASTVRETCPFSPTLASAS